jgi:hypothetical protein
MSFEVLKRDVIILKILALLPWEEFNFGQYSGRKGTRTGGFFSAVKEISTSTWLDGPKKIILIDSLIYV